MRAVIQRTSEASVTIDGELKSFIQKGLLIFIGIENGDITKDIEWISSKICNLRIFNDENGIMNFSVKDIGGEILVISQFTLYASTNKGNRLSYFRSAKAEVAIPLYEKFIQQLAMDLGNAIHTGKFGADMKVTLINDGPVTIIIDTKNRE